MTKAVIVLFLIAYSLFLPTDGFFIHYTFLDAAAQQPPTIIENRGSQEIFEYYNPTDVHLAMAIIAAALVGVFLYLARDIILRKKTEYEKKEFASKRNRDYEKYHSEWTTDSDDIFEEKKESAEAKEFRKMLQDSKFPNYYAVLGVLPDASPSEIKTKYRQLVKEHHPDKTKDEKTAEILAEITKAYDVLSDEEKRKIYDKYYKASIG
jgi:molecular chaperone DnaJ